MPDEATQQLIIAIREAVSAGSFQPDLAFYLSVFFVMAIAAGAGTYIASYLVQKGQNLATKEDFDELLNQQRQSTQATEHIRAEIDEIFGDRRDAKARLREKLEELIQATIELDSWHDDSRNLSFKGESASSSKSPMPRIVALTSLYFPLVEKEKIQVSLTHSRYAKWHISVAKEIMAARAERRSPETSSIVAQFEEVYNPFARTIDEFREALISSYAPLIGLRIEENEDPTD